MFRFIKDIIGFCTYFKVSILFLKAPPLPQAFILPRNVTCHLTPLRLCLFWSRPLLEGLKPSGQFGGVFRLDSQLSGTECGLGNQRPWSGHFGVGLGTIFAWAPGEAIPSLPAPVSLCRSSLGSSLCQQPFRSCMASCCASLVWL